MYKKSLLVSFFLFLCTVTFAAPPGDPVAILSVKNAMKLSQQLSLFLGKENPQVGSQVALLMSAGMMMPQIASFDLQKPVTAYLYFAEPALQPVIFGTVRKGVKPLNIPFLPGQTLHPYKTASGGVMYATPEFSGKISPVSGRMIPPPVGAVSWTYFFRNVQPATDYEDINELAALLSTELSSISGSIDFPKEDIMNISLKMEAVSDGDLMSFSNMNRPVLKEKLHYLPNADCFLYAEIPENLKFAQGVSVFYSSLIPGFSDNEHIFGRYLNTVICGEGDTALAVSRDKEYYLFSGILHTSQKRAAFEHYLKKNGDSYDGKTYIFRNTNGTDAIVRIVGNTALLLVKTHDQKTENISRVFATLKTVNIPMQKREFLAGMFRKPDGTYEKLISGTMANGKFNLEMNLRPADVLEGLPFLTSGYGDLLQ